MHEVVRGAPCRFSSLLIELCARPKRSPTSRVVVPGLVGRQDVSDDFVRQLLAQLVWLVRSPEERSRRATPALLLKVPRHAADPLDDAVVIGGTSEYLPVGDTCRVFTPSLRQGLGASIDDQAAQRSQRSAGSGRGG
jgi:hypothetical protein